MARRNRGQGANRESDDIKIGSDPFIALRRCDGRRGWAAWLLAHTLAFALTIAGWILLAFLGSLVAKLPWGPCQGRMFQGQNRSRQTWTGPCFICCLSFSRPF
jgi:hypothetical protein